MKTTREYRAWLQERRGKPMKVKKKIAKIEEKPFLTWLLEQVERQDDVGRLARDVASEQKRIGRPLTALNNHVDLFMYCEHAPASVVLSREIGKRALLEWVESGRESA